MQDTQRHDITCDWERQRSWRTYPMVRRRLPCPVRSSSDDLLGLGCRAIVIAPQRLDISLLHGEVDLFFALGGP